MLRRALILLALSFLLGQPTIKGCPGFLICFCLVWHRTAAVGYGVSGEGCRMKILIALQDFLVTTPSPEGDGFSSNA